jgi:hypothetical protein
LARCIREKGIELSPEGRAALDALADDSSTGGPGPPGVALRYPLGVRPP